MPEIKHLKWKKKQNKNKKTKAISNENESNKWFAHPNLDFAILIN